MSKSKSPNRDLDKDIEEQLQILAGDIFIQLEDRFNSLLEKVKDNQQHELQNALLLQQRKFEKTNKKLAQQKQHKVSTKYSEIEQLKTQVTNYLHHNNQLKQQLSASQLAMQEQLYKEEKLLNDIRLTNENRALLQQQIDPINKHNQQLIKDNSSLQEQLTTLTQRHKLLQINSRHDISELEARLTEQQQDSLPLIKQQEQLTTLLTITKQDKDNKELIINALSADITILKADHAENLTTVEKSLNKVQQELNQQSAVHLKEKQQLNKTINAHSATIDNLQSQIKQQQQKIREYQQKTTEITQQHNEKTKQIFALSKEKNRLNTETTKLRRKIENSTNLQSNLKKNLQQQSEHLKLVKAKHQEAIYDLNSEHKKLLVTIETEHSQEKSTLSKQLETKQTDIKYLSASLDKADKKSIAKQEKLRKDFEQQLSLFKADSGSLANKVNDLQQKLDKTLTDRQVLSAQLVQQEHCFTTMQSKQKQTDENEIKRVQLELSDTTKQLKALQKSFNDELQKKIAIEQTYKDKFNKEKVQSEQQTQSLKTQINTYNVKQASLRQDITELSETLSNRERSLEQLVQKNKSLTTRISAINEQNNIETTHLRQQLQSEVEKFKNKLLKSQKESKRLAHELDSSQQQLINSNQDKQKIINQIKVDNSTLQQRIEQEFNINKTAHENIKNLQIKITQHTEKQKEAKDKQDKSDQQIRQTLKELRDENYELKTQNNHKIAELEDSLTEYRLKFEYAQKQISLK